MSRIISYFCFWVTLCGIISCQSIEPLNIASETIIKSPITIYSRQSVGPVAIVDVNHEGKYIVLENISFGSERKDVNLDGWILRRTVDGIREYIYNFKDFTLRVGSNVKIFASGYASEAGMYDLIYRDEESWGVGSYEKTVLNDAKGEEKASLVQKTVYN